MANQKRKKNHVPSRLNLLFFAVFILFSALILRLGFVQIVNGEEFIKQLERTSNVTARIDAPRGLLYDRNGNIVVDNALELSLTYTSPTTRPSESEKIEVAQKLEKMIEVDTSKVTERDMKDYWIVTRRDEALKKVSAGERKKLDNTEQYRLTLDRITEEDLTEISDEEIRVLAIKREMDKGYALAPQRIKQGISLEEAHLVGESLAELPGIDILRDASRTYPFGYRSFFGTTRSIPKEKLEYYLSRGYERSDIVGTSFIEEQYESALRGQKGIVENITNRGSVVGEANEHPGKRGNDLVLTIDMMLQQQVENIIKKEVDAATSSYLGDLAAYVIMIDPRTGELLSMAGYDDHAGALNKAYAMGSAVKGATVLAGLHEGVINPGSIIYDTPVQLPQTPPMGSVRNWGNINDLTALEVSSNVYMFHIAMRIAGYNYNQQCCWGDFSKAYQEMRNYYSQFGLGTDTGIDLPAESTGIYGPVSLPGNLLHLSIGQFDTYTPLQLGQYVATIANDGYRMQPYLVKEIREPSGNKEELGKVIYQTTPRVLNRIDMSDAHIKRVQEGFRLVVHGSKGTGRGAFSDLPYNVAAKTGTSQVKVPVKRGETTRWVDGNNQTMVGFAPYDNPEIAFAVVVPNVKRDKDGGDTQISRRISRGILNAYFDLKKPREAVPEVVPTIGEEDSNDEE